MLAFQPPLIDWHHHSLDAPATLENGRNHYVAMRRVVENMGLAWPRQNAKLTEQATKFACTLMGTHDSSGRQQEMLCMPIEKLAL